MAAGPLHQGAQGDFYRILPRRQDLCYSSAEAGFRDVCGSLFLSDCISCSGGSGKASLFQSRQDPKHHGSPEVRQWAGPSVQAVLDKLPTARILEQTGKNYVIEAEVYGDGIKMWLLSQGRWVKVLEPAGFAAEIKEELEQMLKNYG